MMLHDDGVRRIGSPSCRVPKLGYGLPRQIEGSNVEGTTKIVFNISVYIDALYIYIHINIYVNAHVYTHCIEYLNIVF